ncbi:hypothetical protein KVR01_012131 [Diaporthe batatas]|uniref:uncharacterized protein n=1 Tax=Diaporthe batatas TaxID=748121 RepID=UPI001D05BE34|nr:uncharacterized protein KVR01_012131 [Diaporthe batatas]KAG8157859.1 hypothetical protein KVR01_012131 [Diaporthe batatas]
MSSHRILITGGSGYLGGTLLARWKEAGLPAAYDKLYALVRTDTQAEAVKQYGAEPLAFNTLDEAAVRKAVVDLGITIVYYMIDALRSEAPMNFIKALAEVKRATGQEVHFLHTTGAKVFSSHAGAPTNAPLLDTDPELYSVQKTQAETAPLEIMKQAIIVNNTVTEGGEMHGVRTYIFVPCIVYGRGEGFGNIISIQTVAIVKAARAMKRMYKVDQGQPTWPVCHVLDNTTLYIEILRQILDGKDPGHGKNGYFLASPGSVAWDDLYTAMAAALAKRNIIGDDSVVPANRSILEQMGAALESPPELVPMHIGGLCTFTAERGRKIGWKPQYPPEHILEDADNEVQLILDNL